MGSSFFEVQSGALFLQVMWVTFMFGIYVIREYWLHGWKRIRIEAAFAIFVFMAGESTVRAWVWWWRYLVRIGEDPTWMNTHPILFFGASLQMVGSVLIIRVFTPDHWNKNVWFASVLVSVGIAAVVVRYF